MTKRAITCLAAIDLCARGDFGPWLARSRLALAEALVLRGSPVDRDAARKAADIAAVTARTLGMRALLGRALTLADDLADQPRLTDRQREIARLVATGSSNRAIAESLGLSERTVETHVQNLLSRLGFHSRAQIAAWAAAEAGSLERPSRRAGQYVGAIPVPPSVDSTMAGRHRSSRVGADERRPAPRQIGQSTSSSAGSNIFNERDFEACAGLAADAYVEHAIAPFGRVEPGAVNGPRASARGRGVAAGPISRSSNDNRGLGLRWQHSRGKDSVAKGRIEGA